MKYLIILLFTIFIFYCCANKPVKKREVYISELGWTFQLSADLKLTDSAFDSNGKITRPFRRPLSVERLDLFTIRNDSTNWLKTIVIKDTSNIVKWESYHDSDNKWYFKELSLIPIITIIDTSYTVEAIDGINFRKEYLKYFSQKRNDTVWEYHYFGKINNHELAMNFNFSDEAIGRKYLEILNSSKFKK